MSEESSSMAPSSLEPRSIQDLQAEKETRASDILKMKDEQIRILTEQNNKLLLSLDRAEEELGTFQLEKLTIEEENRNLRESNFELQARAKSAEGQLEEIRSGCEDSESQLDIMKTNNTKLLKLLEEEEDNTAKIFSELESTKIEFKCLDEKYRALVESSRELEQTANNAARENHLKSEEIRLLRSGVEQLKEKNSELTMKTTVELETVQEQLRLSKEKQYQQLGKLQAQEEMCRQAEDHAKEMEQRVRDLRQKSSDLQKKLQLETSARISQDNSNHSLTIDFQAMSEENKELRSNLQDLEQDRLKLEVEARENGDKLREMAERLFQVLETLKLADLGKKKSEKALAKKEQELFALKKQQHKMVEDCANEKRNREKSEAEKRLLEDQQRELKKVNSQLGQRLKEETKCKIREEEACKEEKEKVRTLEGRLAVLLNRLQTDEEARYTQQEEMKKMESQIQSKSQRCETLQNKLTQTEERKREVEEKLQKCEQQLKELSIDKQSLEQTLQLQEETAIKNSRKSFPTREKIDNNLAGGQLRFFVDSKSGQVVIKGKSPKDKMWIEEKGCNNFLRKVMKGQNAQDALVQRIAELYGAILFGEEQLEQAAEELKKWKDEVDQFDHELNKAQSNICSEEESKRRILLRYIHAVKASVSLGEAGCEEDREEVGGVGAGRIQLPESCLGDEEVHAVAAMLRNNLTIEELQFRRNHISDNGARAIAAILAEQSALKLVDLRQNHISMIGIKAIADALERSERVRQVFVHPGGKIEALGASEVANSTESTALAATTICVVDVRENKPKDEAQRAKEAEHLRFMQKRRLLEKKGGHNRDRKEIDGTIKVGKTRRSMSQSPSHQQRRQTTNSTFPPIRPSSAGSAKIKKSPYTKAASVSR